MTPQEIVNEKLEEAKNLIEQARQLAEENEVPFFPPIQSMFTQEELDEDLGYGWDSSNC